MGGRRSGRRTAGTASYQELGSKAALLRGLRHHITGQPLSFKPRGVTGFASPRSTPYLHRKDGPLLEIFAMARRYSVTRSIWIGKARVGRTIIKAQPRLRM